MVAPMRMAPVRMGASRAGLVRAGLVPRPMAVARPFAQPRALPTIRGQRFGRLAPYARRGSYGVAGLGGLGFDVAGLSLPGGFAPPFPAGFDGPEPAIIPGIEPAIAPQPPCAEPLIIKVGRGLRHAARTRIVSGSPSACGR